MENILVLTFWLTAFEARCAGELASIQETQSRLSITDKLYPNFVAKNKLRDFWRIRSNLLADIDEDTKSFWFHTHLILILRGIESGQTQQALDFLDLNRVDHD